MEISNYLIWFGCVVLIYIGLAIFQIPLRKIKKWWINLIIIIVKIALAILFAILNVIDDGILIWRFPYFTGATHVVLSADVVIDIIYFIVGFIKKGDVRLFTRSAIGFMATLILMLYGTINMQIVTPRYHDYSSTDLNNDYKIVYITDLHYGSPQSFGVVDKLFDNIKSENPNMIILGGDITDEYTTRNEMYLLYEKIGSLNIPTYFIFGNHDRQTYGDRVGGKKYTEEELLAILDLNNIKVLRDTYELINDDLVVFGKESYDNPNRKKPEEYNLPQNKFILAIDHNPYLEEEITKTNATLQISGHSYFGQYFPLQIINSMFNKYSNGFYKVGNTDLFVSTGVAGWYVPYRTDGFCKYEVFNLHKNI